MPSLWNRKLRGRIHPLQDLPPQVSQAEKERIMNLENMTKEDLEAGIEEMKARIVVLKNEEATARLSGIKAGTFIQIKKGKFTEKIGKVILIGEDYLIMVGIGETRKVTVQFHEVDNIYSNPEEALSAKKDLEDRLSGKKQEAPTVQEAPLVKKGKGFGRK
jgi:hypothetical protein